MRCHILMTAVFKPDIEELITGLEHIPVSEGDVVVLLLKALEILRGDAVAGRVKDDKMKLGAGVCVESVNSGDGNLDAVVCREEDVYRGKDQFTIAEVDSRFSAHKYPFYEEGRDEPSPLPCALFEHEVDLTVLGRGRSHVHAMPDGGEGLPGARTRSRNVAHSTSQNGRRPNRVAHYESGVSQAADFAASLQPAVKARRCRYRGDARQGADAHSVRRHQRNVVVGVLPEPYLGAGGGHRYRDGVRLLKSDGQGRTGSRRVARLDFVGDALTGALGYEHETVGEQVFGDRRRAPKGDFNLSGAHGHSAGRQVVYHVRVGAASYHGERVLLVQVSRHESGSRGLGVPELSAVGQHHQLPQGKIAYLGRLGDLLVAVVSVNDVRVTHSSDLLILACFQFFQARTVLLPNSRLNSTRLGCWHPCTTRPCSH